MKNLFRDLGIAIPPNLRDLDTQPTTLLLLTPVSAADIRYDAAGNRWQVTVSQHNLGRVPLEPVTYKRRTLRPFGSSRISRAVMSLTESAMRTVARATLGYIASTMHVANRAILMPVSVPDGAPGAPCGAAAHGCRSGQTISCQLLAR